MYRNIIELSSMSNNDEIVVYTKEPLTREQAAGVGTSSSFCKPRLVMSRPVYAQEPDSLHPLNRPVDKYQEKAPELTRFLDALFQIQAEVAWATKIGQSPSRMIAHSVAHQFYDCMSGGMSTHQVMIFRHFALKPGIDLTTRVYPDGSRSDEPDAWHSLADWLESTCDVENLEVFMARHRMAFDSASLEAKFLPEASDG